MQLKTRKKVHSKNQILVEVFFSTCWNTQTKYLPTARCKSSWCKATFCFPQSSCQLLEQCCVEKVTWTNARFFECTNKITSNGHIVTVFHFKPLGKMGKSGGIQQRFILIICVFGVFSQEKKIE